MNDFPPASPPDRLRRPSALDQLVAGLDRALQTLAAKPESARPYPAAKVDETVSGAHPERSRIAGLMRVNHSGEVAAQALYHGQAVVARTPATRAALLEAAREEGDHLAWCAERITELGGRTSLLNPLWYCGSFAVGALAGMAGDRESLGFVAETERQVVEHLEAHLTRIPADDARTRAIVHAMRDDEARHGGEALRAGGTVLPVPVRLLMKATARIMTNTARWI